MSNNHYSLLNLNFRSCNNYLIRFCSYLSGILLAANVLRVGDVALCCPEASGRQGYGACKLLRAGLFLNHFKCLLHIFSCTEQINTYR